MDYFAGLDVSVKDTSVCIVDDTGKIVREVKVASEPEALLQVLRGPSYRFYYVSLFQVTGVGLKRASELCNFRFSATSDYGLEQLPAEPSCLSSIAAKSIASPRRSMQDYARPYRPHCPDSDGRSDDDC